METNRTVCPRCGMPYRYVDGVLYPQSQNSNSMCDACHLEEVLGNITARRKLNRIVDNTITNPSLKKQILIPERKQRLIKSVCETIGGFSLSRQEIGKVMDLTNDVEMVVTLLADAPDERDNSDLRQMEIDARQRLTNYIASLDPEKRHNLYSMMLLGRNLDYYGLCKEAVVEFKLRAGSADDITPESISKRPDLKIWLQLVLDLVE